MYKVLEISLHSHKERRRSSQDCSTHTSNACLYLFGEWKFRLWNCSLRVALYSQSLAIFKLKRTLSPIKIFCSSNTKQFRHIQWVILYRKSDLMFIMIRFALMSVTCFDTTENVFPCQLLPVRFLVWIISLPDWFSIKPRFVWIFFWKGILQFTMSSVHLKTSVRRKIKASCFWTASHKQRGFQEDSRDHCSTHSDYGMWGRQAWNIFFMDRIINTGAQAQNRAELMFWMMSTFLQTQKWESVSLWHVMRVKEQFF